MARDGMYVARSRMSGFEPDSESSSPALAAAPAGRALGGHQVVGREFVAVTAPRRHRDVAPDAFRAKRGED